ncbi:CTP--phosphocholine cytidylyltransferase [Clostridium sp. MSJ-4]|uniref:CTP--phosphocholine cytidylyltransferase n=1 Tax=Clostridium simiarum TaxID=2841506 RepID=A0ABS6F1Z2_9CLOT|nr:MULTISPECIES: CTP--phosphocholine cytidylyltransferase [Clostridium]MBU5592521.1 CTP--phosphocholine cytidylyltransferase [Clostridium simiarum]
MRAIILAAGMGTRLRPLTNDRPKSLVEVLGEPMAERQIRFLKEKGIDDILVVTGYMAEKFEYLKDKYGIKTIHNDKYDVYNNIYSMYIVREYLKDAYVTEADVYMERNYLINDKEEMKNSFYFTGIKKDFEKEWLMKFDEEHRLQDIVIGDGTSYIMSGVSYWNEKDGEFISEKIRESVENEDFHKLYWDDIVIRNIKNLDIRIKEISGEDWFEIDSIEDLRATEKYLSSR